MTKPLCRLVEHVAATGLSRRYFVVEDDDMGPILRAGPFWTKEAALHAVARLKVERRHAQRRRLRAQRRKSKLCEVVEVTWRT